MNVIQLIVGLISAGARADQQTERERSSDERRQRLPGHALHEQLATDAQSVLESRSVWQVNADAPPETFDFNTIGLRFRFRRFVLTKH